MFINGGFVIFAARLFSRFPSLPFAVLPCLPVSNPPLPDIPLSSVPETHQLDGLGSTVSSPNGVLGGALAAEAFLYLFN